MKVDFCYVVSHGFALRMLLQTNLIGRLAQKGYKVAIVSLNPDDQNFKEFENNSQVTLVKWNEESSIWDDDYLYKRAYFLEDIDANPGLKEKFYNALFYSKSKHPWKRVRPLYYYLIYKLISFFPGIRKSFLAKEGKYLLSKEADNILDRIEPRMVIATYPVSIMEAKMLYSASQKSIPTTLQLLSWDNITMKGRFPVSADSYLAWGGIMKEELLQKYEISEKDITITGVPHFDLHVEVREKASAQNSLSLTNGKPYIFFAMSSPRFAPKEIDIVEWLASAVRENKFGSDLHLVVRPHPQNMTTFMAKESWLKRLDKLNGDRIVIDYPRLNQSDIRWSMQNQDMIRLSEIISNCSVCLNSGSTVSIDALYHHKPVILTSFDGESKISYWNSARRLIDYTHLRKYCAIGGAEIARSYEELREKINLFLADPEYKIKDRKSALRQQCYKDDGQATERAIVALSNLIEQK